MRELAAAKQRRESPAEDRVITVDATNESEPVAVRAEELKFDEGAVQAFLGEVIELSDSEVQQDGAKCIPKIFEFNGQQYRIVLPAIGRGAHGGVYRAKPVFYATETSDAFVAALPPTDIVIKVIEHPDGSRERDQFTRVRNYREVTQWDQQGGLLDARLVRARVNPRSQESTQTLLLMAIERATGETLESFRQKWTRHRFSPYEVLQVMRGMEQHLKMILHMNLEKRMIHRDIKPNNLMLDLTNPLRARLVDHGIVAPETDENTRTNRLVGTPLYLSSRVYSGKGDVKRDLYGLALSYAHALGIATHRNSDAGLETLSNFALQGRLVQWNMDRRQQFYDGIKARFPHVSSRAFLRFLYRFVTEYDSMENPLGELQSCIRTQELSVMAEKAIRLIEKIQKRGVEPNLQADALLLKTALSNDTVHPDEMKAILQRVVDHLPESERQTAPFIERRVRTEWALLTRTWLNDARQEIKKHRETYPMSRFPRVSQQLSEYHFVWSQARDALKQGDVFGARALVMELRRELDRFQELVAEKPDLPRFKDLLGVDRFPMADLERKRKEAREAALRAFGSPPLLKRRKTPTAVAAALLMGFLLGPLVVHAYDPNYLLDDIQMTDRFSMGMDDVQRWLTKGGLATFFTNDVDGYFRSAAEIIWRAGQRNGISPKFILAMLQKEQGLVLSPTPTQKQLDWAMGYAVCDGCSLDDPTIARFKGFAKQINSSTLQFSEGYLADLQTKNRTSAGYGVGVTSLVDNQPVTPQTKATAALYSYTPHLAGNKTLVEVWQQWFSTNYPNGTLLRNNQDGSMWLIQNNTKRRFASMAALRTRYPESRVVSVSPNALDGYSAGREIVYPNYSLFETENGTRYLLVDDAVRPIAGDDAFRAVGFVEDDLVTVASSDIADYPIGEMITKESSVPQGALWRVGKGGTIFYVENGKRYLIPSDDVRLARFPNRAPEIVSTDKLEGFQEGQGLGFPDGTLVGVRGAPAVYVIDQGKRRHIPDEKTFLSYGWSWPQVIWTTEFSVAMNALGEPLTARSE